jgi:hypothetical protein
VVWEIAAAQCCCRHAFVFTWLHSDGFVCCSDVLFYEVCFVFALQILLPFLHHSLQVFAARFRVMNPYKVLISNVTMTLVCSALKVRIPPLMLPVTATMLTRIQHAFQ